MDTSKRLFIGSDHAGLELKTWVAERLAVDFPGIQIEDCGTQTPDSTDYPIYAAKVAEKTVKNGGIGVLICGSGIGMSIAANKVRGARAALVWDVTSARLSRQHNGANIVCVGSRLVGREVAIDAIRTFLKTSFEEGRHAKRLDLIHQMEDA